MELFKLKFKLYLRLTHTSPQATTGTVESDTYIHILYTQVYLGCVRSYLVRDQYTLSHPQLLTGKEVQLIKFKTCMHTFSHKSLVFIQKLFCCRGEGDEWVSTWRVICLIWARGLTYILQCIKSARVRF